MYRSILISFLAGSMMTILSGSAQAQKAPKPAASNLNLSKSNINKVAPPVDPADKSKPNPKTKSGNKAAIQ